MSESVISGPVVTDSSPTQPLTSSMVRDFISATLIELGVDETAIADDATIDDLGLDSLDLVDLTQSVKNGLSVVVSTQQLEGDTTLATLIALVCVNATAG